MCSHSRDQLAGLLVRVLADRPQGVRADDLCRTLIASHEICLEHFAPALKDAAGDGRIVLRGMSVVPADIDALLAATVLPAAAAPGEASEAAAPPRTIAGRYEVVRLLGSGSSGDVYLAKDGALHGRLVALKVIALDRIPAAFRDEAVARFEREIRVLAKLHHPHVIGIIDSGREGQCEILWYAMEYAPGGSLESRVEDAGPIPAAELLSMAIEATEGLDAAHREGVLHRDVKPSNILLARSGAVLVADFGLARLIPHPSRSTATQVITRGTRLIGTMAYMAPEVFDGREQDHRADIYSLGATLYHAAAGRPPFALESTPSNVEEVRFHRVNVDPPDLLRLVPEFDADFAAIIRRAIARTPEARWPSYRALLEALYAVLPRVRHERQSIRAPEPAVKPPTGVETAMLRDLETEAARAVEEWKARFGAAAFAAHPDFMHALWALVRTQGLLATAARLQDAVPATEFESRLEEALDGLRAGHAPLRSPPLDLTRYLWRSIEDAQANKAAGLVADTSSSEAMLRFLADPAVLHDPTLAPFALQETVSGVPGDAAVIARATAAEPTAIPTTAEAQDGGASAGIRVSGYDVISELGEGGMATVFKARQRAVDRVVALKVFRPRPELDSAAAQRFEREARNAARVTHPNVVQIYDAGKSGDVLWIAMEYVPGRTLESLASERRRLKVVQTLHILRKVALGLEALHRQDLFHRDIKPANIILDGDPDDPERLTVKVADFGLLMSPRRRQQALTERNVFIGTVSYASPEQVESADELDGRSDIFSLGVVAYELLSGRLPYDGITALLNPEIQAPPLGQGSDPVPADAESLVQRMIAKPRDRRIANTHELVGEIDRILARLERGESPAPAPSPERPARRSLPVVAVAIPLVALGALVVLLRNREPKDPGLVVIDRERPVPAPPSPAPPATREPAPAPPTQEVEIAADELLPVIIVPTSEDLAPVGADAPKSARLRHAVARERARSFGPTRADTLEMYLSTYKPTAEELAEVRMLWALADDAALRDMERGDCRRTLAAYDAFLARTDLTTYTRLVAGLARDSIARTSDFDKTFRTGLVVGNDVTIVCGGGKAVTGVLRAHTEKGLEILPAGSNDALLIPLAEIAPESAITGVADVYDRLEYLVWRGNGCDETASAIARAIDARSGLPSVPEAVRLVPFAIHALASRGVRLTEREPLDAASALLAALADARGVVPPSLAYAFEPEGVFARELEAARTLAAGKLDAVISRFEGTRARERAVRRAYSEFKAGTFTNTIALGEGVNWTPSPKRPDGVEQGKYTRVDSATKLYVVRSVEESQSISRTLPRAGEGYAIALKYEPDATVEASSWAVGFSNGSNGTHLQVEWHRNKRLSLRRVHDSEPSKDAVLSTMDFEAAPASFALSFVPIGDLVLIYFGDRLAFSLAAKDGPLSSTIKIGVSKGQLTISSVDTHDVLDREDD